MSNKIQLARAARLAATRIVAQNHPEELSAEIDRQRSYVGLDPVPNRYKSLRSWETL